MDRVGKKKKNADKSLLTQDQYCGDIDFTDTHGVIKSACV